MKKVLLALALFALAADTPEAMVKYRQSVMKTLAAQLTAMSLVAKHEITPNADRLILHATTAAEFSHDLAKLFPLRRATSAAARCRRSGPPPPTSTRARKTSSTRR
jgi:cytochrome c556